MCLAIPGRLLRVQDEGETACAGARLMRQGEVLFGAIIKRVNLAYVPEAAAGDYVLVHAGFAIARVDEQEAQRTLAWLESFEPAEPAEPGEQEMPS